MNKFLQILFLMLPTLLFAQRDTIAHIYTFGGLANDNGEDIEATSDGGYIVVGATASNSYGNTDVYLLKVDSNCGYQWSKAIGGTNNDWGYSVKQTTDKGFIIAASSNSYGNGGYDAVLMKRDSLGNYQWRKVYGGNDWDFAYDVIQTHDSGFAFCGATFNNSAGLSDVFVVKTNNLGDTIWTKTIGGTLSDQGNSIIETSDSNLVIAGLKTTITDSAQAYIIKLDFNGTLLWDSIYGGTKYETASAIIETNSGDYVLTGTSTSANTTNDKDFYLLKTNKNGAKIWGNIFGNLGDQEVFDIIELANGYLFNSGYTKAAGGGGKDAQLFLVSPIGLWANQSSTFGGVNDEVSKSIILGKNGSMKMVGFTNGFGNGLNDLMIIDVDTVVTSQQFTIDTIVDLTPLTVNEIAKKSTIYLSPNPASKYLKINSSKTIDKVEIYNIIGQKLTTNFINNSNKINTSQLHNGLFIFNFYSKGKLISTNKVVVSH